MKIIRKSRNWKKTIECSCKAVLKIGAADLTLLPSKAAGSRIVYAVCPFCKERFDFYFDNLPRAEQILLIQKRLKNKRAVLVCCDNKTGQLLLPLS